MSSNSPPPSWWELHLRQARGEPLSAEERRLYETEMVRQDKADQLGDNLDALRTLRTTVTALAHENAHLRQRLMQLEAEVQTVEEALSKQTQQLLGVQE